MAERKLAHVETIAEIKPHPNGDKIELAKVLGWQLVVMKDEFKPGDKCVYIEIDSKVDVKKPEFAFLESCGGKIKTRKFRGELSQGIALPLEKVGLKSDKYNIGDDLTKVLGIVKIQTAEEQRLKAEAVDPRLQRVKQRLKKFIKTPLGKFLMKYKLSRSVLLRIFGGKAKKRKAWPDFIAKTDETRIENIPQQLKDKRMLEVTEKLDGTSTTFFIKKGRKSAYEFGVCSRNVRQLDEKQSCYHDHNIYWDMAFKYDVENVLNRLAKHFSGPSHIVLQGESIGSVQGNPYKLSSDDFYGFNLIVDGRKIDSVQAAALLKTFGIKWVPILQTDFICPDTMEEMKALADGMSVINPKVKREGCVYRDAQNTISFKNVSNQYLLSKKD